MLGNAKTESAGTGPPPSEAKSVYDFVCAHVGPELIHSLLDPAAVRVDEEVALKLWGTQSDVLNGMFSGTLGRKSQRKLLASGDLAAKMKRLFANIPDIP